MMQNNSVSKPLRSAPSMDGLIRQSSRYTFLMLLISLGLTLLISAASYPGYMSFDSIEELRQARGTVEGSQYPPFGSYVWRIFDWIWPGPALMHFVQNGLLLASFSYLVSRTRLPLLLQIACLCVFAFAPPLFGTMLVVWKDVAVAACYMLAIALFLGVRGSGDRRVQAYLVLGLFATWCGMAYRFNAASGALPLIVLGVHRLRGQLIGRRPALATIAAGVALMFVLFAAVWAVNSYRFPSFERLEKNTNSDSIMRFDLIGISRFSGKSIVPGNNGQPVPASYVNNIYDPRHLNITAANDVKNLINRNIPEIGSLWIRSIIQNPIAYLKHRTAVFREYIGLHQHDVFYITHPSIDQNTLGVTFHPTQFKSHFVEKMWEVRGSIICRPYFYYVLAAVLVFVASIFGDRRYLFGAAFALTSGYLYLAPMFFITPAADLRYNFWSVAASILASIYAIASIVHRPVEVARENGTIG